MLFKVGVLKNFAIFTTKPATLLKRGSNTCFPVNTTNFFFIEHLWWLLLTWKIFPTANKSAIAVTVLFILYKTFCKTKFFQVIDGTTTLKNTAKILRKMWFYSVNFSTKFITWGLSVGRNARKRRKRKNIGRNIQKNKKYL